MDFTLGIFRIHHGDRKLVKYLNLHQFQLQPPVEQIMRQTAGQFDVWGILYIWLCTDAVLTAGAGLSARRVKLTNAAASAL